MEVEDRGSRGAFVGNDGDAGVGVGVRSSGGKNAWPSLMASWLSSESDSADWRSRRNEASLNIGEGRIPESPLNVAYGLDPSLSYARPSSLRRVGPKGVTLGDSLSVSPLEDGQSLDGEVGEVARMGLGKG